MGLSSKEIAMLNIRTRFAQVNVLYHDWTQDPLFYKNAALLKKIGLLQNRYRELAEAYPSKSRAFVRNFLIDSGIAEAFFASLGFDLNPAMKSVLIKEFIDIRRP